MVQRTCNAKTIAKELLKHLNDDDLRIKFTICKEECEEIAHIKMAYLSCLLRWLIDEYYNKYEMMSIGSAIDILQEDDRLSPDFGKCDILFDYGWANGENDILDYHFDHDKKTKLITLEISKPVQIGDTDTNCSNTIRW